MTTRREYLLNEIRHQEVIAKYSQREADNEKCTDSTQELFRDQVKMTQKAIKDFKAELAKLAKGKAKNVKKGARRS
jgi:hypothetical protein